MARVSVEDMLSNAIINSNGRATHYNDPHSKYAWECDLHSFVRGACTVVFKNLNSNHFSHHNQSPMTDANRCGEHICQSCFRKLNPIYGNPHQGESVDDWLMRIAPMLNPAAAKPLPKEFFGKTKEELTVIQVKAKAGAMVPLMRFFDHSSGVIASLVLQSDVDRKKTLGTKFRSSSVSRLIADGFTNLPRHDTSIKPEFAAPSSFGSMLMVPQFNVAVQQMPQNFGGRATIYDMPEFMHGNLELRHLINTSVDPDSVVVISAFPLSRDDIGAPPQNPHVKLLEANSVRDWMKSISKPPEMVESDGLPHKQPHRYEEDSSLDQLTTLVLYGANAFTLQQWRQIWKLTSTVLPSCPIVILGNKNATFWPDEMGSLYTALLSETLFKDIIKPRPGTMTLKPFTADSLAAAVLQSFDEGSTRGLYDPHSNIQKITGDEVFIVHERTSTHRALYTLMFRHGLKKRADCKIFGRVGSHTIIFFDIAPIKPRRIFPIGMPL